MSRQAFQALADAGRPAIAFIVHGWGGGIRRHVDDLASLVGDRAEVLFIEPAAADIVRVRLARTGAAAFFALPAELSLLASFLRALGVVRLHLHHVNGLPQSILDLLPSMRLPYDVTLHDYMTICPQLHLVAADGRYCGEPAVPGCTVCLNRRPPAWPLDIVAWRSRFATVLRGAARVIAPSIDVAARIRRYVHHLDIEVWPHAEAPIVFPALARVATMGMLSAEKGLHVVAACAQDAHERSLPLSFRILGAVGAPLPNLPAWRLSFTGEYTEAELPRLLAAERPSVLWFPAQVPETYAYTLSAAIASGLPIVASDLGALRDRLEGRTTARIVRWNATPAEWNDALESLTPEAADRSVRVAEWPEHYRDRYLAPLTVPPSGREPLPIDKLCFEAPIDAAAPEMSLEALTTAGVLCGRVEARSELLRRASRVDEDFGALQAQVRTLTDQLSSSRDETNEARERVEELEGSTTWRMTAPVRAVVQGAKTTARRFRSGVSELHRLPVHASLAMTLLRDEGPRSLSSRVVRKLRGGHRFRPRRVAPYKQAESIQPLAFAPASLPVASIVIPVYGKPLLTYTCLRSVHAQTAPGTFEVIVVDDASPEVISTELAQVEGVRFERNATNLGFIGSCNRGVELARGEFVVLLNNDTIVTEGWLDALLRVFAMRNDAGIVGAKLVYPDGRLQEAGGIVWNDGSAWNVGRDDDPDTPAFNYLREADYVSGACLAIRRSLFREIGGFDARFAPAYYEDTDLAFAVRAAGWRVYYQPDATIVHFEGQTSGTDVGSGVKRHQTTNRAVFRDKWRDTLRTHRSNGSQPELERDRGAKRRILFVDACMLTPDQDSGSMRTLAMLELMAAAGSKVTFVADNLEHRQPYVRQLQQRGVEVEFAPYVRSVSDLLRERGHEFDIVVLARHYVAARHVDDVRKHAPKALLAFDTVDLHFLRAERLADLEQNATARLAARARRDEELSLIRRVDVTIVVSPVEREVLREAVPDARVLLLSNIHDRMEGGKPFAERQGLVFIGGFQHPPNTDAVLWYAREVLPLVRERLPGVVTYIVGSKVPATIRALASDDFVVTGYVADVTPFFTGCRVSIAPLRYGAGVKGKVNLAMSYGLPVVATPTSVEGMHLAPGEDVLVAEDAPSFAAAVERAYRDEALWHRLSANGSANIERHFSRDVANAALLELFAAAASRKRV